MKEEEEEEEEGEVEGYEEQAEQGMETLEQDMSSSEDEKVYTPIAGHFHQGKNFRQIWHLVLVAKI